MGEIIKIDEIRPFQKVIEVIQRARIRVRKEDFKSIVIPDDYHGINVCQTTKFGRGKGEEILTRKSLQLMAKLLNPEFQPLISKPGIVRKGDDISGENASTQLFTIVGQRANPFSFHQEATLMEVLTDANIGIDNIDYSTLKELPKTLYRIILDIQDTRPLCRSLFPQYLQVRFDEGTSRHHKIKKEDIWFSLSPPNQSDLSSVLSILDYQTLLEEFKESDIQGKLFLAALLADARPEVYSEEILPFLRGEKEV